MHVQDFMTADPLTVEPDISIETALAAMDEYHVRHLPVVENERLVGVISNRDLLGHASWRAPKFAEEAEALPRFVRDVMHQDVVTVSPEDEAVAAAVEVSVRAIGCLPVTDGGKLVGIVSEMDLIRLVSEKPSHAQEAGDTSVPSVGSVGTAQAITVTSEATFTLIDSVMSAKGIRHVPVMDGDELLGIVSDRDMRRALGENVGPGALATEFMTKGVITVTGDLSLVDAAAVMSDRKISALVVTSEAGELGMVTSTDILEYALNSL